MRAVTILYIQMLARMTREKKLSLISLDTVCTVEHLWMWVFLFKCLGKKIYFTVNKVYSARTYSYILYIYQSSFIHQMDQLTSSIILNSIQEYGNHCKRKDFTMFTNNSSSNSLSPVSLYFLLDMLWVGTPEKCRKGRTRQKEII